MSETGNLFSEGQMIASVSTIESFQYAVTCEHISCVMLKFGDIETIGELIASAHWHKKIVIAHLDAIKGVAKDQCGVKFLAKLGVDCLNTTKPQLIGAIRGAGVIAIQVMFLVDGEALKAGIESINKNKPDAVIVMPMSIPGGIIREMSTKTKVALIAGGLLTQKEEIDEAAAKGFCSLVTSRRELWDNRLLKSTALSEKLKIL